MATSRETSDAERREVAERLRRFHRRDGESQLDFIAHMVYGKKQMTAADCSNLPSRLAELIDRPTCTVENVIYRDSWEEYEVQLSCGHEIITTESADGLAFCQYCGAEVVPDGC